MFYSQIVLSKKGPLGYVWIAAHWDRKVTKFQVFEANIVTSSKSITDETTPLALRVSGHLLLGLARIYARKVMYLFGDCTDALSKIKTAFRPDAIESKKSKSKSGTIALPTFDDSFFEADDEFANDAGGILMTDDWAPVKHTAPEKSHMAKKSSITRQELPSFSDATGMDDMEGFQPFDDEENALPMAHGTPSTRKSLLEMDTPGTLADATASSMGGSARTSPMKEMEESKGYEADYLDQPFMEEPTMEEPPMEEVSMEEPAAEAAGIDTSILEIPPEPELEPAPRQSRRERRAPASKVDDNVQLPDSTIAAWLKDTSLIVAPMPTVESRAATVAKIVAGEVGMKDVARAEASLKLPSAFPDPKGPFSRIFKGVAAAELATTPLIPERERGEPASEVDFAPPPVEFDAPPMEQPFFDDYVQDAASSGAMTPSIASPSRSHDREGGSERSSVSKRSRDTSMYTTNYGHSLETSRVHSRTSAVYETFKQAFQESEEIRFEDSARDANVEDVAAAFLELLVLSSRDVVDVEQDGGFADIVITKAKGFDTFTDEVALEETVNDDTFRSSKKA